MKPGRFEVAVLFLFVVIIGYQLFIPPLIGAPDNGDFSRFLVQIKLQHVSTVFDDNYFSYYTSKYRIIHEPLINGDYKSSTILFIAAARWFNIHFINAQIFDVRVLAAIYLLFFLLGMYLILISTRILELRWRIPLAGLLLLMFTDPAYTAYFSSFFSEATALVCLVIIVGCSLVLIVGQSRAWMVLVGYFMAVAILITAKPMYVLFGLLLVPFGIYLSRLVSISRRYWLSGILACLLVTLGIWYYPQTSPSLRLVVNYLGVFNVLKFSPTPDKDLIAMGLNPEWTQHIETTPFDRNGPFQNPAFMDEFKRGVGSSTVPKFLLTHPERLYAVASHLSLFVLTTLPHYAGYYEKESGKAPVTKPPTLWSAARSWLFRFNIWLLFGYLGSGLLALVLSLRRRVNELQRGLLLLYGVLVLIATSVLVVPTLTQASFDTRYAATFASAFDMSLLFSVTAVFWWFRKKPATTETIMVPTTKQTNESPATTELTARKPVGIASWLVRIFSAVICLVLLAAVLAPPQWATRNPSLYACIYVAVLWGSAVFFSIWPGVLKRPSDRRFIAIILILFVVSRLAWVLLVPTVPFSDFAEYNIWAVKLGQFQPIQGDMFRLSIQLALQPWLYPISLGVLYDIFGQHLIVAKLANVVAGALSVWLFYKLANHLFNSIAARLATILFLLWPTQLMFTSVLAAEHLAVVLSLGAFVPLVSTLGNDKTNYRSLIIAGFLLGLSFVTRYPIVLAIPSFIFALLLTKRSFKLKVAQGSVLVGAFLLTFLLYLGVVSAVWRQFHLPDSGLQLLEGTNLATGGTFTIDDTHLFEAHGTVAEANRFARAEAYRRITSHPRSFIRLMGHKTVVYWKDDFDGAHFSTSIMEPGAVSSFLKANDRSLMTASQYFHLTVLVAAALGCFYLLLGGGHARLIMILSMILGGTLLHSILVVHSRYHYPSEPFIIMLAAFGTVTFGSKTLPWLVQRLKFNSNGLQGGKTMADRDQNDEAVVTDVAGQKQGDTELPTSVSRRKPVLLAVIGGILLVVLFTLFGGWGLFDRSSQPPSPTVTSPPTGIQPSGGSNKGTISLDPNPLKVCDGSGLAVANVSFAFPSDVSVEVRVESPNGPLFAAPAGNGTSTTGKWVTNGMAFYLQDVTGGKALSAENTLATATARITIEGCQ